MSAASGLPADRGLSAARRPPAFRLPSTRFYRSELALIFTRRRNLAGLAVLAAVPVIIGIAVRLSSPQQHGTGDGDPAMGFLGSITNNGLFVALAALAMELPLFLPMAVAAISADTIAGEANTGTLRYLLTVPVHRTRMLVVKYLATATFAAACTLLVAVTGTLVGLALFGGGAMASLGGTTIGFGSALLRLLGVCWYITICLCSLAAVGLFVSTLTEQPIGATIAIMLFVMVSLVLNQIPQVSAIHPYLITYSWMAFGEFLRDPVSFSGPLAGGLLRAAAYTAIFTTAAWARLANRDVSC